MTDTSTGTLDSARAFAEQYVVPAAIHVAIALIVFLIGRLIARGLLRGADRVMERGKVDVSLRKFLGSLLYAIMFVAIVIASLDTVGVRTTAIVAVLGAAGITIGLALQGSLSNFAAGVVLILERPYRVGDLVTIGKYLGRVDAIKAFYSVIVTLDEREITLPNAQVVTGPIENLSRRGTRVLDLLVTIDGGASGDVELATWRALLAETAGDGSVVDIAEVTPSGVKLRVHARTTVDAYAALIATQMQAIRTAVLARGATWAIVLETPVV